MRIKPCPNCGRAPKISEGRLRNGHRFYSIGCPNYCDVLSNSSKYGKLGFLKSCRLYFNEDYDYNTMYKKWNEELIDGSH